MILHQNGGQRRAEGRLELSLVSNRAFNTWLGLNQAFKPFFFDFTLHKLFISILLHPTDSLTVQQPALSLGK